MRIKAIKLRDRDFGNQWKDEVENRWEYADFVNNSGWKHDWISFDCLCYDPPTDTVFCGITSFAADIFWGWNRAKGEWISAGYERIADRFDAKFHRALVRDPRDGSLYGAQALLHDIDRFWEAPGASIVRYNPRNGDIAKLATPMPHVYIQALAFDVERNTLYGQTFPPENLVSYNIATGESRWIGPTSSGMSMAQGENIELDGNGNVWGIWTVMRAWQSSSGPDTYRFYRYSSESGKIEYLDRGLPLADGSYGYARPEAIFNLGTGCLYVSGDGGALFRLDPESGESERLFQPIYPNTGRRSRLASMRPAPDNNAYGIVGRDGQCEIMRFDPRSEKYELLGALKDSQTGASAWQIHDVCIAPDGVIYAAENDNPRRSSYLWEIRLDEGE